MNAQITRHRPRTVMTTRMGTRTLIRTRTRMTFKLDLMDLQGNCHLTSATGQQTSTWTK